MLYKCREPAGFFPVKTLVRKRGGKWEGLLIMITAFVPVVVINTKLGYSHFDDKFFLMRSFWSLTGICPFVSIMNALPAAAGRNH